MGVMIL